MRKVRNRKLALLLVFTMLATLFVAIPAASAKSVNSVDKVVSIASDFNGDTGVRFTLQEDKDFVSHFVYKDTFSLKLPSGVKWNDAAATGVTGPATAVKRTDQVLEITFTNAVDNTKVDAVTVPMDIKVDGATGVLQVEVDPLDSGVTGGKYDFAVVASGKTTVAVDKVKKIGQSGTGGTIEIKEASIGAVGNRECTLTLKLPPNFEWNGVAADDISKAGGFATLDAGPTPTNDGRTLTVKFDPQPRTQRGILYIPAKIKALKDAAKGEIEVSISGSNAEGTTIADASVVVAEYVDYGITAKVASVKELVAGKFAQKTDKITLEENVPGTLLKGRDLTIELPSWVKITDVDSYTATNVGAVQFVTEATTDGKKNYADFNVAQSTPAGTTGKIEFKLVLSIEGNQSGDIEAVIKGAGVEETKLVIAKVINPASVTVASVADLKIGVQDQAVGNVVITEGKKEAFKKTPVDGQSNGIVLTLTEGAKFAATPTVAVTEGNLEIEKNDVKLGADDKSLIIPIKSESTKASKIEVSNIKLTLDRTIPEGALEIKVGGASVVENSRAAKGGDNTGASDVLDKNEFATSNAVVATIAKVITPAPGETKATTVLVAGSTTMKVNGADVTMDVAPYLKNSRLFVSVRFAAQALGVDSNNILWDQATKTATLMTASGRVIQMTVGSKVMTVNGAKINMDVAPEMVSNRVMLPVGWLAQALGATATWDNATSTATLEL